jgi:hypothetical protein
MCDIVNLKRYRRRLAREEKERKAHENRERFGRSRVKRTSAHTEKEREARRLDGHKRDS